MTYDFNTHTGELNRLTSEGARQLGFIVCPYSGGDRGELTVFKFLFRPTTQIPLTDGDLQAILTFGSGCEKEARAAYLSQGAAQEPSAETKSATAEPSKASVEIAFQDGVTFQSLVSGMVADCKAAQETKTVGAETPAKYGFFKADATAEETNPTVYGFAKAGAEPTETKTKGDAAADLDSVAERILNVFTDENDSRTDADLLAASGVGRDRYTDIRDFLLMDTSELCELEDTVPVEYVRTWPRKTQAAA